MIARVRGPMRSAIRGISRFHVRGSAAAVEFRSLQRSAEPIGQRDAAAHEVSVASRRLAREVLVEDRGDASSQRLVHELQITGSVTRLGNHVVHERGGPHLLI